MNEHLKLLGLVVTDVVTGFSGVVTSISFDLYGCIQAIVTPAINAEEQKAESFDTKRLTYDSPEPVMKVPDFVRMNRAQISREYEDAIWQTIKRMRP